MLQLKSDVLMMAREPAVICRGDTVVFANGEAVNVLGKNCVGKSAAGFFGSELFGMQSASFVGNILVNDKRYIARVLKADGLTTVFFAPDSEVPILINEAFIYSLRSHLMNIGAAATMIRERAESERDEKILSLLPGLTRSYYGLTRLLSNASAVRGIEMGELPFIPVPVNMSELCAQNLKQMAWLCRGFDFKTDLGNDITLNADPTLITLLLLNLLSNCLVRAGKITRVSVNLFESQGSVVLSVSDDGCGIPQNELYQVFDRYRHNFDMKQLGNGVGLGLTVARGVAAIHGGTLLLESRVGHGTTVRASFKKDCACVTSVKASQSAYSADLQDTLVGLVDFLPAELYTERYID